MVNGCVYLRDAVGWRATWRTASATLAADCRAVRLSHIVSVATISARTLAREETSLACTKTFAGFLARRLV